MNAAGTDYMPVNLTEQNEAEAEACDWGGVEGIPACENQAEWAWESTMACGHTPATRHFCSVHHYRTLKVLDRYNVTLGEMGFQCAVCGHQFKILNYYPLTT